MAGSPVDLEVDDLVSVVRVVVWLIPEKAVCGGAA